MTNRITTGSPPFSTLQRLIPIGIGGILSLALSGCSAHLPMQSMAPGPTVDHGFPGVSVTKNSDQWPPVHGPEQNSEHRIYTEVPPPPPGTDLTTGARVSSTQEKAFASSGDSEDGLLFL